MERLPRRPLRRMPRCALPSGAHRAPVGRVPERLVSFPKISSAHALTGSDNPYRRSYSSWCPTNSGTPPSNLPGAFPVVSVGVSRPEAIEPTQRLCRLPERQGFRKLAGRTATRLNPERPKAIAGPFRSGRSSNQPRPCLAMYPIEYLVDRFLFSSGEPVVCARSAWLVGSRLIRTINDNRRKALRQLPYGTEKVGRAQIPDVVHDQEGVFSASKSNSESPTPRRGSRS